LHCAIRTSGRREPIPRGFLNSERLAFAREHELWESLQFRHPEEVALAIAKPPKGRYVVSVHEHQAALADTETFYASVLIQSYALAEAATADRLGAASSSFGGSRTGVSGC
jgi:hypothetical protein